MPLIKPLVPAWVDLREYDEMPLDVDRLRDSRFTATRRPDEFRAGVLLWCAAWKQVPASSLPNDDVELAKLAGYGFGVKDWKKVKAGALYGYVLAEDGRLYHETAASKALKSWESKLKYCHERYMDRMRKLNRTRAEAKEPPLPILSLDAWKAGGADGRIPQDMPEVSTGIPPSKTEPSGGIPAENSLNRSEGKVREGTLKPRVASQPVGLAPDDTLPGIEKPKVNGHDKGAETRRLRADAVGVIEFLNTKAHRAYQPVPANVDPVVALFKQGFTVTQCRQVIAKRVREWGTEEKMERYLRPKTLFNRTNFANYAGELVELPEEDHAA